MRDFEYLEPRTIKEAVQLLQQYRDEAKVLAGGQSLLVMMRQGLIDPSHVVSLEHIEVLRGIHRDGQRTIIGAMTTHDEVSRSPLVAARGAPLAQAAGKVGSPHVRNLGTLGGNLCHAEVGADPPPALIALGAQVRIAGPNGERVLEVEQLFKGFLETVVQSDEVLTRVEIPDPPEGAVGVYLKHTLRSVDRALVGAACLLQLGSDHLCRDVRLGLGGVAATPLRARKAEAALRGQRLTAALAEAAGEVAMGEVSPISDAHGSADYRRKMVKVFVKRALTEAAAQAGYRL